MAKEKTKTEKIQEAPPKGPKAPAVGHYLCIQKCFFNGTLYKDGKFYDIYETEAMPEHFQKVDRIKRIGKITLKPTMALRGGGAYIRTEDSIPSVRDPHGGPFNVPVE